MAKRLYHLEVEEDSVKEYYLAIHTLIEAHKLAFYINQKSLVLLSRSKKDINNKKLHNLTPKSHTWINECDKQLKLKLQKQQKCIQIFLELIWKAQM